MQVWGICYKEKNEWRVMRGYGLGRTEPSPGSLPGVGKCPAVGCQDLLSQRGGFVRVWTIGG